MKILQGMDFKRNSHCTNTQCVLHTGRVTRFIQSPEVFELLSGRAFNLCGFAVAAVSELNFYDGFVKQDDLLCCWFHMNHDTSTCYRAGYIVRRRKQLHFGRFSDFLSAKTSNTSLPLRCFILNQIHWTSLLCDTCTGGYEWTPASIVLTVTQHGLRYRLSLAEAHKQLIDYLVQLQANPLSLGSRD